MNFDWVNSSTFDIYSVQNLTASDHTILSPFYCNGGSPTNGGCADKNTRIYSDIHQNTANYSNNAARLKAMDILPEDGWELLKYSFGRAKSSVSGDQGVGQKTPFFWLYNRYTGKSKFFMAVTSLVGIANQINSATIRFSGTPYGQYNLFANAGPITPIFSGFNHTDNVNMAAHCDIQPVGSGSFTYYWLYAEFVLSYDPCVCRGASQYASLDFDVFTTNSASFDLEMDGFTNAGLYTSGGLNADGKSVIASSVDDNVSLSNGNQIVSAAKAAIQGYKDWDEHAKKIKEFFNTKTNNGTTPSTNPYVIKITNEVAAYAGQGSASSSVKTTITHDYLNGLNNSGSNPNPKSTSESVQNLSGLAPQVLSLASALPYVGAMIGLYTFLADAGSNQQQVTTPPPAPPSVTSFNAEIKGAATFNSNVTNGYIYLPGSQPNKDFGTYNNEDNAFPIYNNPLGVFTIIDVPFFEFKTIPTTNNGVDTNDPNQSYSIYEWSSFSDPATIQQGTGTRFPFNTIRDYKLSGPVSYALNPSSNLYVKNIDAAMVFEYKYNDPLVINHDAKVFYHGSTPTNQWIMKGNSSSLTQIPYYPDMKSEYDPYSATFTADNLTTVINQYANSGIELEYATDGFQNANGTNTDTDAFIRLRTKYVPLQSLHNIDFVLLGDQNKPPKIYLKLYCKFGKKDKPDDEPVTFIITYDISSKMVSAQSAGSGGSATYNYYFVKDQGTPAATEKAGDYALFNNLKVFGAYNSPNYSSNNVSGPITISGSNSGVLSNGNISLANSTNLVPSGLTNNAIYSTNNDVLIGDNVVVSIGSGETNKTAVIMAQGDISIGKSFVSEPQGTNNGIAYYAKNDISLSDNYQLGYTNGNLIKAYSGHNILLQNQNSSSNCIIRNTELYALNEIEITETAANTEIYPGSVLSSEAILTNTYTLLYGDGGFTNISELQASDAAISSSCSALGNRAASVPDDTVEYSPDIKKPVSISKPLMEKGMIQEDYQISIYPNPSLGNFNLLYNSSKESVLQYTLRDVLGREANAGTLEANQVKEIDGQQLNNGIYFITFEREGKPLNKRKIIIMK
jgi:hypothetical protein